MKLQGTYGKIKHISADAGSQMLPENLDLSVVGKEGEKLFGFISSYRAPARSQYRNYSESKMETIKKILNRLMELGKSGLRKEIVELFLIQTCDIINATPYSYSPESINLSPASFLGFRRAPEILWMKEVEENSQTGKSMSDILDKLKDWHLSNVEKRKAQINASNAKFLVVKETTNKSSHIKPTIGDIVVINTTKDSRNIGQIIAIERQTARVLCQDRIFRQPISYLTPLYTEEDKA